MSIEQFEKASVIMKDVRGLKYFENYLGDAQSIKFLAFPQADLDIDAVSQHYFMPKEILQKEFENMKINLLNEVSKLIKEKEQELAEL